MAFEINKWADEFFSQKQHPMSDQESRLMIAATMGGVGSTSDEVKALFQYQLGAKRAEVMGLAFQDNAMAFLSLMCETPGAIVMYLSAFRAKGIPVTMSEIVNQFPMGFPSKESLSQMWDKQKGETVDNELDAIKWESSNGTAKQSV